MAVTLDLLTLGVFKYYGFFVANVDDALRETGMGLPLPLLTIALPVGVSFFTFQAISYVVDVKRRLVEPASMIDVAIYLSSSRTWSPGRSCGRASSCRSSSSRRTRRRSRWAPASR